MYIDYRQGGHWEPRSDLWLRRGRRLHGWRHGEPYAAMAPEPHLSWGQFWHARRPEPSWVGPQPMRQPAPVFRTPQPLPPPDVSADPPPATPPRPPRPRDPQTDGSGGRMPSQQTAQPPSSSPAAPQSRPEPAQPGAERRDVQQSEFRFERSSYRPLFDFRREDRYRDRRGPWEGEVAKPAAPATRRAAPARRLVAAGPPPVTVQMSESQLREWIEKALEGAHKIGNVAEIIEIFHASAAWPAIEASLAWGEAATVGAGAGALGALTAIAVPVGYVALMGFVAFELYKAFSTGTRIQTKMGYCYGIVWAALGMPNLRVDYESMGDWIALGGDSIAELRAAFEKGVNSGREKFATDVKLHNQVLLRLAYEQITKDRHGWTEPGQRVLDLIWAQVHGDDATPDSHLSWLQGGPFGIGTTYTNYIDDNRMPPSH
jgi:hypothetical protein